MDIDRIYYQLKIEDKLRNRSIMIGPKGNIVTYYDKIKMFDVKLPNKEQHQGKQELTSPVKNL